jgi:hypothetical protein
MQDLGERVILGRYSGLFMRLCEMLHESMSSKRKSYF